MRAVAPCEMIGLQVGTTRAVIESVELLILITILILSFGVAFAIQKAVLGSFRFAGLDKVFQIEPSAVVGGT